MSPEQAQGQRADARSDIFALGAMLYEMLSGRRAFAGNTPADTLAAVLRSDPPEIETDGVPPGLERVVRRCLEKDPGERFQSAHDLGLALETLSGPAPPTPGSKRRRDLPAIGRRWAGGPRSHRRCRGSVVAPGPWTLGHRPSPVRIVPFTADGGFKFAPRLSPDGERVAYSWTGPDNDNWDVYVKAIGRGTKPLRLTEHKANDWGPVWSPDGRQIAFVRELETGAAIYTVPSLGGQERRLTDVAGPVRLLEGQELPSGLRPGLRTGSGWLWPRSLMRTSPPASSACHSRRWKRRRSPLLRRTRSAICPPSCRPTAGSSPSSGRPRALGRSGRVGAAGEPTTGPAADVREVRLLQRSGLDARRKGAGVLDEQWASGRRTDPPCARRGRGAGAARRHRKRRRLAFGPGGADGPRCSSIPSPWGIWRIPGRRSSVADRRPEKLIASRWNDDACRPTPRTAAESPSIRIGAAR